MKNNKAEKKSKWHKKRAEETDLQIKKVLLDGEQHQYGELLKTTKLSKATLSKHLKNMEKENIIEKRIDTESGQYPYPVYYELVEKDDLLEKIYRTLNETVQIAGNRLEETHDAKRYLEIMNQGFNKMLLSQALNMQKLKKKKFKDEKEIESEIEMDRLLVDTVLADAVKQFAKMFLVKSFSIFSPEEIKALSEEVFRK